jgi:hypothetical protein
MPARAAWQGVEPRHRWALPQTSRKLGGAVKAVVFGFRNHPLREIAMVLLPPSYSARGHTKNPTTAA